MLRISSDENRACGIRPHAHLAVIEGCSTSAEVAEQRGQAALPAKGSSSIYRSK